MVAHKSKQEKNVDGTIISISLVERLKDFPQDRLVEEVIELWDEINKLEVKKFNYIKPYFSDSN